MSDETVQRPDPHSFSTPESAVVEHIDLDLMADFSARKILGVAKLRIQATEDHIVLDTDNLSIRSVTSQTGTPLTWALGETDPILGTPLTIYHGFRGQGIIQINYSTQPSAKALQWLTPKQAASNKPFLFSQGETILTRSWIPCQDTPAVRQTWSARIRTASDVTIVMSGQRTGGSAGWSTYDMPIPVPSYLIAIAAGDLVFATTGPRTGVWALPEVVKAAATEFRDMEQMVDAAISLYGPYDWKRFEALIMPASFPFGGMENPCLTFITPSIITGDRSLVSTVVHELAHAWSGNKVTNSTWADTWLNEGLTVYSEHRLVEALYGKQIADLQRATDGMELKAEIERLGATHPDTRLVLDLEGRDPDDAFTYIPYNKGVALWRKLEQILGRSDFDATLQDYVERFAWQSIGHQQWIDFWKEILTPEQWEALEAEKWLYGTGVPDEAISFPDAAMLTGVRRAARSIAGKPDLSGAEKWVAYQWVAFIRLLSDNTPASVMCSLDEVLALSTSRNAEIRLAWCLKALKSGDMSAWDGAAGLVGMYGRAKLVTSLYRGMKALDPERAAEVYAINRDSYHGVVAREVDALLAPKTRPTA